MQMRLRRRPNQSCVINKLRWWRSVVVSALASINVVNRYRARLVLGWVIARGLHLHVTSQVDSAFYPLRDGKMSISFRAE